MDLVYEGAIRSATDHIQKQSVILKKQNIYIICLMVTTLATILGSVVISLKALNVGQAALENAVEYVENAYEE